MILRESVVFVSFYLTPIRVYRIFKSAFIKIMVNSTISLDYVVIDLGSNDDFSSVACYAAGDLDDLRLGQTSELKHAAILTETLRDFSTIQPALQDPTAVVIFSRVLKRLIPSQKIETVQQVANRVGKMSRRLTRLLENPKSRLAAQYHSILQPFCLALSKEASRYQPAIKTW